MLLNADVGEGLITDRQLFPFLDQANIACGGHAGDQRSMQQAVMTCIEYNVLIGAHPSYPDKDNFGRSSIDISFSQLTKSLQQQVESLNSVCEEKGTLLSYIKPHGALYNDIMIQHDLFSLVVELVADQTNKLSLMLGAAVPNQYIEKANQLGVTLIREAFADRQYLASGQLSSRLNAGAVFSDAEKISHQVVNLKSGLVEDENGNSITLNADSICIHGDNPASVQAVESIAQILRD